MRTFIVYCTLSLTGCVAQPEAQTPIESPDVAVVAPRETAAAAGFTIPCDGDTSCGAHRCNVSIKACAMPCSGAQDCVVGSQCNLGLCMPSLVQSW
jgi:hypothetical protein